MQTKTAGITLAALLLVTAVPAAASKSSGSCSTVDKISYLGGLGFATCITLKTGTCLYNYVRGKKCAPCKVDGRLTALEATVNCPTNGVKATRENQKLVQAVVFGAEGVNVAKKLAATQYGLLGASSGKDDGAFSISFESAIASWNKEKEEAERLAKEKADSEKREKEKGATKLPIAQPVSTGGSSTTTASAAATAASSNPTK